MNSRSATNSLLSARLTNCKERCHLHVAPLPVRRKRAFLKSRVRQPVRRWRQRRAAAQCLLLRTAFLLLLGGGGIGYSQNSQIPTGDHGGVGVLQRLPDELWECVALMADARREVLPSPPSKARPSTISAGCRTGLPYSATPLLIRPHPAPRPPLAIIPEGWV